MVQCTLLITAPQPMALRQWNFNRVFSRLQFTLLKKNSLHKVHRSLKQDAESRWKCVLFIFNGQPYTSYTSIACYVMTLVDAVPPYGKCWGTPMVFWIFEWRHKCGLWTKKSPRRSSDLVYFRRLLQTRCEFESQPGQPISLIFFS